MTEDSRVQLFHFDWVAWGGEILHDLGIDDDNFPRKVLHKHLRSVLHDIAWADLKPQIEKALGWYDDKAEFASVFGVNPGNITRWLDTKKKYGTISLPNYLAFLLFFRDIVPRQGHDPWIRQVALGLMNTIDSEYLHASSALDNPLSETGFEAIHLFFNYADDVTYFRDPNSVDEERLVDLFATVLRMLNQRPGADSLTPSQLRELILTWNKQYVLLRFAFEADDDWDLFDDDSV